MAINLAKEEEDYRFFKQPFEIKDIDDLKRLTQREKEMFAEKLRLEIHEYQHRETAYVAKRKELLEIENAYRVLQVKQKIVTDKLINEQNEKVNVIDTLNTQVNDFVRKKKELDRAKIDLADKMGEANELFERREEELGELTNVLGQKDGATKQLQASIEELKQRQQDMIHNFEGEKEQLFNGREGKETMNGKVDQIAEKLRQAKQQQFILQQSISENERKLQEKRDALKQEEQNIGSGDSELTRLNSELTMLQSDKAKLEDGLSELSKMISKSKQQRLLQHEFIRNMQNGNSLLKQEIERKRSVIEEIEHNVEQLYRQIKMKQVENDALIREIEALSKHIVLLEDQNNELERELDKFLLCDNEIREKLKDRNRSPLRLTDLYSGITSLNQQESSSKELFSLQKCKSQQSSRQGSEAVPSYRELRKKSPESSRYQQQPASNPNLENQTAFNPRPESYSYQKYSPRDYPRNEDPTERRMLEKKSSKKVQFQQPIDEYNVEVDHQFRENKVQEEIHSRSRSRSKSKEERLNFYRSTAVSTTYQRADEGRDEKCDKYEKYDRFQASKRYDGALDDLNDREQYREKEDVYDEQAYEEYSHPNRANRDRRAETCQPYQQLRSKSRSKSRENLNQSNLTEKYHQQDQSYTYNEHDVGRHFSQGETAEKYDENYTPSHHPRYQAEEDALRRDGYDTYEARGHSGDDEYDRKYRGGGSTEKYGGKGSYDKYDKGYSGYERDEQRYEKQQEFHHGRDHHRQFSRDRDEAQEQYQYTDERQSHKATRYENLSGYHNSSEHHGGRRRHDRYEDEHCQQDCFDRNEYDSSKVLNQHQAEPWKENPTREIEDIVMGKAQELSSGGGYTSKFARGYCAKNKPSATAHFSDAYSREVNSRSPPRGRSPLRSRSPPQYRSKYGYYRD